MAYRNPPLSLNPADDTDYEVPLTAANSPPSGVGTVHATYASPTGNEVNLRRRAPKQIQIQGFFTGTDAANADWLCRYWSYNPDTTRWMASEDFHLVGNSGLSATQGHVKNLAHDPNARFGFIEAISGVSANQVLEATIVAREW